MAISAFIPQIWDAQLLRDFRAQAVAANLVNRSYEGTATRGNTVKITTAVDVAVSDYAGAGRTTSPAAVDAQSQDLLIDKEKAFDFFVDDIDRAQAAGSMDAYTASAAAALAEDADKSLLAIITTAAGATAETALTDGNAAYDKIRDLRKAMNKALVPQNSRYLVVNAEFESLLLGADSKLTSVDTSGSPAGLRDATLGRLLGFTVITSENLPKVDTQLAVAFHGPSVAYVSQIQETEALRANDKFADRLRGLHVYGHKVFRPNVVAAFDGSL